jgi:hypothetical protein
MSPIWIRLFPLMVFVPHWRVPEIMPAWMQGVAEIMRDKKRE